MGAINYTRDSDGDDERSHLTTPPAKNVHLYSNNKLKHQCTRHRYNYTIYKSRDIMPPQYVERDRERERSIHIPHSHGRN